jgi:hypothetical protein
MDKASSIRKYANLLAIVLLVLGLVLYLYRIDAWFMHDDEGGYSYAVWRISQGEKPYRDFLTPQLPVFLYLGALVVKLFGPSALALRYATILTTLLAGFCVYLLAKRLFGYRVALFSLLLFLVHRDIYFIARFFRPEAYMLLFALMGMYVFILSYQRRRYKGMFLAGALMGLAMLCKLFAALPFGGCVLFLLYEWFRSRDRTLLAQVIAAGAGFLATAGTVSVAYQLWSPVFLIAVFEHHVMQGAQLSKLQVIIKGLEFYWSYMKGNPVFLLLALLGGVLSLRAPRKVSAFFALQLPTATAFLILSRDLSDRHLVYLVPALAILAASVLDKLISTTSTAPASPSAQNTLGTSSLEILTRLALGILLAALAIWPSYTKDREVSSWEESGTRPLADYIQTLTSADDYVLCDYAGVNFHAQRLNTYLGAGLSGGATSSGQITGAALIREIEDKNVKLVVINTSGGAHQMVALHDYEEFYRYVQSHFRFVRIFHRSYETSEIYCRDERMALLPDAHFGGKLALTGADLASTTVPSGNSLPLALRWQALASMPQDYTVSLRLVDEQGHLYGQDDTPLRRTFTSGWQGALELIEQAPTSQWPSGVQVIQETVLRINPGTPPGSYRLMVLLYNLATGEVLSIRDAQDQAQDSEYALTTVQVTVPETPPTVDQLAIHQHVNQDLSDLRLLGRGPVQESVRPGDALRVVLFWQVLREPRQDWQLVLRVRAADGSIAAEGRFELANASHPTSQWSQNEVIMGQCSLILDGNAITGPAELVLNCIDKATRLPALQADYVLAPISIVGQSRQFTVPVTIQHRLDVNLGDHVTLLGYDLTEQTIRAGGPLQLTLYWQALTTMDTSYTVFTHVLGSDGRVWGQKDSVPLQGSYPSTTWAPGEVVSDPYFINVASDAPAGQYVLEVGMYVAATGRRLPVIKSSGQQGDDRVLLPSVLVGP